jgi:hypothetical protein
VRQTYTSRDLTTYAATPPDYPQQRILIDCFNIVTLASTNSDLPDDGDYTKTFWICFIVNFNTPFKKLVHLLVIKL